MAGNAVALDHVGMLLDKGIKYRLLRGVDLQIDKGGDREAELFMVDLRPVAGDDPVLFQLLNAGGRSRRGKEHPLGQMLERHARILLQHFDQFHINFIHMAPRT